jgi:BirA family biotin operon repressor/biotin-[acetyl-CoA-carboxylase] ligase
MTSNTGLNIQRFDILDSTSTEALRCARSGAAHGTVLVARSQTGGRGRDGRKFHSPPGGLYFSIIIRPALGAEIFPLITLAAGAAVHRVLGEITGLDSVKLKWPNDIFVRDAKVAGLLTETGPVQQSGVPEYVVCGVGVNLNTRLQDFPADVSATVDSLSRCTGVCYNDHQVLVQLAEAIVEAVDNLERDRNRILAHWRKADYLLDRPLECSVDGKVIQAVGAGLADDGRYMVRDRANILYHVLAGDLKPLRIC